MGSGECCRRICYKILVWPGRIFFWLVPMFTHGTRLGYLFPVIRSSTPRLSLMNNSLSSRFCRKKVLIHVLILFILSLILQSIIYHLINSHNPVALREPDSESYLEFARMIQERKELDSWSTLVRTPGYPFVLYMLGAEEETAYAPRLLNHAMIALVVLMFYGFLQFFIGERLSFIWSLVLAAEPTLIVSSNQIMTDSLFIFLFCLSLIFLALALRTGKWFWWLIGVGIIQDVAILVRPILVYWPVLQGCILFVILFQQGWVRGRRKRWHNFSGVVLLLLVSYVGPLAWSGENLRYHGYRTVSWIGMENLLHYKVAQVLKVAGAIPEGAGRELLNARVDEKARGKGEITLAWRAAIHWELMFDAVKQYPLAFVWAELNSFRKILTGDQVPQFAPRGSHLRVLYNFLKHLQLIFNILLLAGVIYFMTIYFRVLFFRPVISGLIATGWFSLAIIIYFCVLSSPEGCARFRVPIIPEIYLLAALGINVLLSGRDLNLFRLKIN